MNFRLIAAAVVAAALGGCSAVSELPTWEQYRADALNNSQVDPNVSPAGRCYEWGAVAGTAEHARCEAAITELRAMPHFGAWVPAEEACGKVAVGGSPLYQRCIMAHREGDQQIENDYRELVNWANAEDARRSAAFAQGMQNMSNNMRQQQYQRELQQQQMRANMPVVCTTGPAYGGMSTTTCR